MTDPWEAYLLPEPDPEPPHQRVLRSVPGFTTNRELREFEYGETAARAIEVQLGRAGIPDTWDVSHCRAIHRHLFQNVYPWAGQFRNVEIEKVFSVFASVQQLPALVADAGAQLAIGPHDPVNRIAVADWIARAQTVANVAHPFREGNGRATRAWLDRALLRTSFEADYSRVTPLDWFAANRKEFVAFKDGQPSPGAMRGLYAGTILLPRLTTPPLSPSAELGFASSTTPRARLHRPGRLSKGQGRRHRVETFPGTAGPTRGLSVSGRTRLTPRAAVLRPRPCRCALRGAPRSCTP